MKMAGKKALIKKEAQASIQNLKYLPAQRKKTKIFPLRQSLF